ncbi:hypothetical protein QWY28_01155 [Nocardioides sp. SOB77]|uniref:PASTA domain-containing protein n=1 Tax=Nocardioides oceani TaxID=3058369 RepID=A0ABT8FAX0_9ACTN|nr:hypothetical protein [Nocardioides oceani]MDN4171542.1 hypothetical protein [Nocardioides oceani]
MSRTRPVLGSTLAGVVLLAGALTSTGALLTPALADEPSNDDFANAQAIPTTGGTVTGDNTEATGQDGEPNHADSDWEEPLASMWYSWTASADGATVVHTCTGTTFDSRLAVYTGTALRTVTEVAANDDSQGSTCRGSLFSEVSFTAVAGTTYRIAVDSVEGIDDGEPVGAFSLTVVAPEGSGGPVDPEPVDPPQTYTMKRFIPTCAGVTATSTKTCGAKATKISFTRLPAVKKAVAGLRAQGFPITLKVTEKPAGSQNAAIAAALRKSGKGGEVLTQSIAPRAVVDDQSTTVLKVAVFAG